MGDEDNGRVKSRFVPTFLVVGPGLTIVAHRLDETLMKETLRCESNKLKNKPYKRISPMQG